MTISGFPKVGDTISYLGTPTVDPVTGALALRVMDYGHHDIGETFRFRRSYISGRIAEDKGDPQPMGIRWAWSVGGKAIRNGARLQLPIGGFRWEAFSLQDGAWEPVDGNKRYRLRERGGGYLLKDLRTPAEYQYDEKGNLVSIERQGGFSRKILHYGNTPTGILLASGKELQLEFEDNRLSGIVDPMGRKLSYAYEDGLLRRVTYPNHSYTQYDYDETRRLIRCLNRKGELYFYVVYDDLGRVVKLKIGKGKTFSIRYAEQDWNTIVLNEATLEYRIYYWNRRGQIVGMAYEDGAEFRKSYDAAGRCIYLRDRLGREFRYEYNKEGLLLREIRPTGWILENSYDSLGRLVGVRDNFDGETQYVYNGSGWLIKRRTRLTGRGWCEEEWERDTVGRILSYARNGGKTTYAYEGNAPFPTLMETPCGDKFSYRYDKAFRLLAIHSSLGDRLFSYNVFDLMARELDAMGHEWIYRYDLQGNPLEGLTAPRRIFPDIFERNYVTGAEQEAYKDQEQWICKRDAKGRLLEVRRTADQSLQAEFRYDIAGRKESERIRISESEGFRLCRWKYDNSDNMIEQRIWLDPQDETSTRGRIHILRCEYDKQDRLIRSEDNQKKIVEFSYDSLSHPISRKIRRKDHPVQVTKYLYDPAGRLVEKDEKSDYAKTGKLWENTVFSLDKEGNCLSVLFPDGEERTGEAAETFYRNTLERLPHYRDVSGYMRTQGQDCFLLMKVLYEEREMG